MRLTLRFFALVGALLLAVATSVAAGFRALDSLDRALARVVDTDMPSLLAITHARRAFRSMTVLERDMILAQTPAERAATAQQLPALAAELTRHLDRYESLVPAEDALHIAALRAVAQRWLAVDAAVLAACDQGRDQALDVAKRHKLDPVSWEREIGELVTQSEARLGVQVAATHEQTRSAQRMLLAVSGAALLVALALGGLIFRAIRRNVADVVRLNGDLEGLVGERTAALDARERSLRLVLDSTGDGLLLVDTRGILRGQCSRAAVQWFGEPRPDMTLAEYLEPFDENARLRLKLAFEQLAEDVLPWEVALAQLPRVVQRGPLILELEIRPLIDPDLGRCFLVVTRNVTERLRGEQAERSAREQQAVVSKLLSDRVGFAHFVSDTEQLIAGIAQEQDGVALRRLLHTLKGNAALFGMQSMADTCHALEDALATSSVPPVAELVALAHGWQERLADIEVFLGATSNEAVEVDPGSHLALLRALGERRPHAELSGMVEMWSWTPTAIVLGRIRAQIELLARQLGKRAVVRVEDNDIRIPPGYLEELWPTLVHVARNAVDHGIEPESERVARGKPPAGQLALRTRQTDLELVLELCDDGPGIDLEAVTRAARARGLDPARLERPELLIFEDGLTTRQHVTELSGRGVGLSATLVACRVAGGVIDVETARGSGTTIRMRFRRPIVRTDSKALERGKRWTLAPSRVA